jgi:hypothetical protein
MVQNFSDQRVTVIGICDIRAQSDNLAALIA